jgi:hypothetical protein
MNTLTRNPLPALAATVLLAVATPSSFASNAPDLATLVYAGGEALSPDAELQLWSRMREAAGGALARDDVKQDLALARESGLLAAGGEIADTPRVLQARADFNLRQTREILDAHEAERLRMAAQEAVARARQMAAVPQDAGTQTAMSAVDASADRQAAALPSGPAAEPDAATSAMPGTAPIDRPTDRPADSPTDRPNDAPADRPVMAPSEAPVSRPSDLPVQTLVDPD